MAATAHRCRSDWAVFVRDLLDRRYRDAERVVLVMDQLNTHSPASLYQAFPHTLHRHVAAWEEQRNAAQAKVTWQFTTSQARIKLKASTHQFKADRALGLLIFRTRTIL